MNLPESESNILLDQYRNAAKIRRQYRTAWILYVINTIVTVALYILLPADRPYLLFYLYACTGPLLCHGSMVMDHPALRWMKKAKLDRIIFMTVGITLLWRAMTAGRQGLYLYLLMGTGPLMMMANVYTGLRVYEAMNARSPDKT